MPLLLLAIKRGVAFWNTQTAESPLRRCASGLGTLGARCLSFIVGLLLAALVCIPVIGGITFIVCYAILGNIIPEKAVTIALWAGSIAGAIPAVLFGVGGFFEGRKFLDDLVQHFVNR